MYICGCVLALQLELHYSLASTANDQPSSAVRFIGLQSNRATKLVCLRHSHGIWCVGCGKLDEIICDVRHAKAEDEIALQLV